MVYYGGDMSFNSAKSVSDSVRQDIALSSFTTNDDKSVWEPKQRLLFLGTALDFEEGLISVGCIFKLKSFCFLSSEGPDCSQRPCFDYRANY